MKVVLMGIWNLVTIAIGNGIKIQTKSIAVEINKKFILLNSPPKFHPCPIPFFFLCGIR